MITPQVPDSRMSAPVTKDKDGNANISVPGGLIKYAQVGGCVGVSDLDCAMYMTGANDKDVRDKLYLLVKIKETMQAVYNENPISYHFHGAGRKERLLVQKDGIKALCAHVGGSQEKATAVIEALDSVQAACESGSYIFEKDEAGNWFIPGKVFGGTNNVRLKANENNVLVVDAEDAIMAITGMSKKQACLCWSDTLKEHHKLIRGDLSDEQSIRFTDLFFNNTF